MRVEFIWAWQEDCPDGLETLLEQVGRAAIAAETLTGAYEATLILTGDEEIAGINREQRGIDRPTDVLSFPSVTYPSGTARHHARRLQREFDPQTGCIHLGDIVLSLPRAAEQAAEYGHSRMREVGYLFAHGMLHLLGYDHETDEQRAQMRAMEEKVMDTTGLSRELTDADFALINGAREAMAKAYAPYSKYKVGACVRDTEGNLYKGCNVENASYGMTICAERNAMTTAVTEGMRAIDAIAIASEGAMPYPCGACRQFMREFAKDMKVILVNDEAMEVTSLCELLPCSFGPESLLEGVDK